MFVRGSDIFFSHRNQKYLASLPHLFCDVFVGPAREGCAFLMFINNVAEIENDIVCHSSEPKFDADKSRYNS